MAIIFGSLAFCQTTEKWLGYWETPISLPPQKTLPAAFSLIESSATIWILIYQKGISSQDMPSCIFEPSCSRFALKSIHQFGFLKGTLLAGDRLMRCNPFGYKYYKLGEAKFADPPEHYRIQSKIK
ncbi:MAG: membrane protein insertion efficiency factor YidD [Candidatus Neomarinimicrobiota bacterium]